MPDTADVTELNFRFYRQTSTKITKSGPITTNFRLNRVYFTYMPDYRQGERTPARPGENHYSAEET